MASRTDENVERPSIGATWIVLNENDDDNASAEMRELWAIEAEADAIADEVASEFQRSLHSALSNAENQAA